jgi:hypothetical protein
MLVDTPLVNIAARREKSFLLFNSKNIGDPLPVTVPRQTPDES